MRCCLQQQKRFRRQRSKVTEPTRQASSSAHQGPTPVLRMSSPTPPSSAGRKGYPHSQTDGGIFSAEVTPVRSGMSLLLVSPGRTWSCLRHQMSPSQNTAILILLRQKPNTSALSHKENLSAWAFEENVPSPDSVLKLKTHLRSAQERGLRGNSEDQAPHFPNMMKSPQQRCALTNICLFNGVSCCVRAPAPGAAPEQALLLLSSLCRIRNLKER